ncbi:hypothetical protein TNCT_62771 [Trichonephila clavata]|uniref:Uncharacterized protein n=1 Tax=Trichonephila clavata TaxID=2740835 RepID=A0A8X6J6F3_TRICU|nr:hypothetical protein TNCT_62771 [Trichonephila clavata]
MDFESDSSHSDAASPASLYPPNLDDLYDKLKNAKGSLELLTVCSFLDCKINDLLTHTHTFTFSLTTPKETNMELTSTLS